MSNKSYPASRQYPGSNEHHASPHAPFVPKRSTVMMYEYSPEQFRESGMSPTVLDLIARTTVNIVTRRHRDGHSENRKGVVLIISPRPHLEDAIGRSLNAAGADCSHILVHRCQYRSETGYRRMRLPDDIVRLRNGILRYGADLVVIDPLNGLLDNDSGIPKQHRIQEVRSALKRIASETEVAIIVGIARIEVITSKELATRSSPSPIDGSGRHQPMQQWDTKEPSVHPVLIERLRRNLPRPADARQNVLNAIEFLKRTLADRPHLRREVETRAKLRGIKPRTLRTARERLGIVAWKNRVANGRWVWELPPVRQI